MIRIINDIEFHFDDQNRYHREDGPAVDGPRSREWFIHGVLHRDDGPAVELFGCHNCWYQRGVIHRNGGPAIEFADGSKRWFWNGKKVSEKKYWQLFRMKAFI